MAQLSEFDTSLPKIGVEEILIYFLHRLEAGRNRMPLICGAWLRKIRD